MHRASCPASVLVRPDPFWSVPIRPEKIQIFFILDLQNCDVSTWREISGPERPRCRKMAQVPKSNPGLISVPGAWPPARNPSVVNLQQTGLSRQARNRSGTASGQKIRKKLDFGGRLKTHGKGYLDCCLLHFFCLPCGGGLSGEIGGAAPTRPILHMLSNLEVSYDIEFHIITELEFWQHM